MNDKCTRCKEQLLHWEIELYNGVCDQCHLEQAREDGEFIFPDDLYEHPGDPNDQTQIDFDDSF